MIPRDTALVGSLVLVGMALLIWALRRRPSMAWLVLIAATFVYAALVVVATLFPLPIQNALIQY